MATTPARNKLFLWVGIFCSTVLVYVAYPSIEYTVLSYCGVLFWTGFLQYGIENTDQPEIRANFYSMLEEWDKRVEIDKEHDFFSTRLNSTTSTAEGGEDFEGDDIDTADEDFITDSQLHLEESFDLDLGHAFIYFMDGIHAMSNNGEPEIAISYLERYNPVTEIQMDEIQMNIDLMKYQEEMILDQTEYIVLATDLLQDYQFATHVSNPHIYVCYFTLLQIGQFAFLFYTYKTAKREKRTRFRTIVIGLIQILALMFVALMYVSYFSTTHLDRLLYEVPYRYFLSSLIFTDMEIAHRPSVTLERARQIFLKYPYVYEDLCSHQAMSLMYQVLLHELDRCNHPLGISYEEDEHDDMKACKSTHKVLHTIASMMDANGSMEYIDNLEFWYEYIDVTLETAVIPNVDPRDLEEVQDLERSARLKSIADDWLLNIYDHENFYNGFREDSLHIEL